ncbi:uncharacterized protein LOC132169525 [Corylus avellana]|uniref:uncharacterized protein LOC132169525 n=1 Tax=Corylus avellana TaxID=13451 RepID=UPI00286D3109|nr:uncharacterized protein LOC132169525 [Corylus avellana]
MEFCYFAEPSQLPESETWVANVDVSSTWKRGGAKNVLTNLKAESLEFSIWLAFTTTNNEAEYEVVIAGLSLAQDMGAKNLEVRSDSQVVVGHIQGEYRARGGKDEEASSEENSRANFLARLGSSTDEEAEALEQKYSEEGKLLDDKKKAQQIRMRSARYTRVGSTLYKRGYTLPLLKCITKAESEYVIREIHEGVCDSHEGSRMLAHKAIRAGYYWPGMNQDSSDIVKNYDKCQRFAKVTKNPPEELSPISAPWSFAQWGSQPSRSITPEKRRLQIHSSCCRLLHQMSISGGTGSHHNRKHLEFLVEVDSVQANGLVEATNKTLMKTLKKKLEDRQGVWVGFLPEVLWSYITTTKTTTWETPFALTFGTEAMVPVELGSLSYQVEHYNSGLNEERMRLHLDLLHEKQDGA